MKNTPVHRQEWILEELKREPLLSYGEMWAKYGLKWGKRKTTFNTCDRQRRWRDYFEF